MYDLIVQITFFPSKDLANIAKHGVSLAEVKSLDWDTVISVVDDRNDYGEIREVGLGLIGDRLHCVVFTRRADALRIIRFRKANRREINDYVQAQS